MKKSSAYLTRFPCTRSGWAIGVIGAAAAAVVVFQFVVYVFVKVLFYLSNSPFPESRSPSGDSAMMNLAMELDPDNMRLKKKIDYFWAGGDILDEPEEDD